MDSQNALHGRGVVVSCADTEHQCTIVAGCKGEHPFRAIDARGRVQHDFNAQTAKQLRIDGATTNMMLI